MRDSPRKTPSHSRLRLSSGERNFDEFFNVKENIEWNCNDSDSLSDPVNSSPVGGASQKRVIGSSPRLPTNNVVQKTSPKKVPIHKELLVRDDVSLPDVHETELLTVFNEQRTLVETSIQPNSMISDPKLITEVHQYDKPMEKSQKKVRMSSVFHKINSTMIVFGNCQLRMQSCKQISMFFLVFSTQFLCLAICIQRTPKGPK